MSKNNDLEKIMSLAPNIRDADEPDFTLALEQYVMSYGVVAFKSINNAIRSGKYPKTLISRMIIKIGQMEDSDEYLRLVFLIECLHCSYAYIRNAAAIALSYMTPNPKIINNIRLAIYKENSIIVKKNLEKVYNSCQHEGNVHENQIESRREAIL